MTSAAGTEADARAAALAYLAHGWAPIPMETRGKRPVVPWLAWQHRLPSIEEVKQNFGRSRHPNVGIITGVVSGLIVLDVDPRHGGEPSLAAVEREYGPLPVTVEALTGGGGRHFYFAHPGGVIHNKAGLMDGIDLRGDGGCVVAPPSVHPSGHHYAWAPGRSPRDVHLAPMPYWLLQRVAPGTSRHGHPLHHWRALLREGVAEGERNTTIASLAGHLLWHGVDASVVLELLLAWNRTGCRPPLDDDEVARTVDSIARLHARQHPPVVSGS